MKNQDSQVYLVKIVYFCPFKRKLLVNDAIESKYNTIIYTIIDPLDASG